jgi:hypothetical protein
MRRLELGADTTTRVDRVVEGFKLPGPAPGECHRRSMLVKTDVQLSNLAIAESETDAYGLGVAAGFGVSFSLSRNAFLNLSTFGRMIAAQYGW